MKWQNPLPILFLLFFYGTTTNAQNHEVAWIKNIGGNSEDIFTDLKPSLNGGYIGLIRSRSTDGIFEGNYGKRDTYLVEVDENGETMWSKNYGGEESEWPSILLPTCDGYIVSANTQSNLLNGHEHKGSRDSWIFKVDKEGDIQWEVVLGGSGFDAPPIIRPYGENGCIAFITTRSNDGDFQLDEAPGVSTSWLLKINGDGEILSKKQIPELNGIGVGNFLIRDDGYIYGSSVDGESFQDYDLVLFKCTLSGEMIWQRTIGGSRNESGGFLYPIDEETFFVTGWTESDDLDVPQELGFLDTWVLVVNNDGEVLRQRLIGGDNLDYFSHLERNTKGEFLIGLKGSGIDTFDIPNYSMCIFKISTSLELSDPIVLDIDSVQNELGEFVSLREDHIMLSIGNVTNSDYSDEVYLGRIDYLNAPKPKRHFSVYPNPGRNCVKVSTFEEYPVNINFYNTIGQFVHQEQLIGPLQHLSFEHLNPGIYMITIEGKEEEPEPVKFFVH